MCFRSIAIVTTDRWMVDEMFLASHPQMIPSALTQFGMHYQHLLTCLTQLDQSQCLPSL
jgi:hypothetical protein